MAAGTEILRVPKAHRTGMRLLVATIVLLAAVAATFAVISVTSEPTTVRQPVTTEAPEVGTIAADTGAYARPCIQWGKCATVFDPTGFRPARGDFPGVKWGTSSDSSAYGDWGPTNRDCVRFGRC